MTFYSVCAWLSALVVLPMLIMIIVSKDDIMKKPLYRFPTLWKAFFIISFLIVPHKDMSSAIAVGFFSAIAAIFARDLHITSGSFPITVQTTKLKQHTPIPVCCFSFSLFVISYRHVTRSVIKLKNKETGSVYYTRKNRKQNPDTLTLKKYDRNCENTSRTKRENNGQNELSTPAPSAADVVY